MSNLVERVRLDAFLPFVMAAAQGLPEAMAVAYVRAACIAFCTKSSTLRRRVSLDMQRAVSAYPVWPDPCEQIVRINEVCVHGTPYRGTRDGITFAWRGGRFTVADGLLSLSSPPQRDEPDAIEIRMTVVPTQAACEVDATLFNDWRDAIEDGALAKIYLLPGYSFTQPVLAKARQDSFDGKIATARVRSLKSDTTANVVAMARPFV